MSTFGKKALNSWNYKYSKETSLRFNHSPMDLQLEILKKWYPIGMECVKFNLYFKNYDHFKFQIVGYEEIIGELYNLELLKFVKFVRIDETGQPVETYIKEKITAHPVHFKPTDEYFKMMDRENKLNNLGI